MLGLLGWVGVGWRSGSCFGLLYVVLGWIVLVFTVINLGKLCWINLVWSDMGWSKLGYISVGMVKLFWVCLGCVVFVCFGWS